MNKPVARRLLDPVDGASVLVRSEIEPGLQAFTSPNGGVWLRFADYDRWLTGLEKELPGVGLLDAEEGGSGVVVPETDSPAGKPCPDDGAFLIRRRVSADLPFHVNRCGHCGGMWFDADEWSAVKRAGLVSSLGSLFTDRYQTVLRQALVERSASARMESELGSDDYADLERVAR